MRKKETNSIEIGFSTVCVSKIGVFSKKTENSELRKPYIF